MNMQVTHNLADHAILANLSIRQWTARRYDRSASDTVNTHHGATDNAARVNKRLIAKDALAKIQVAVSSARADHDKLTLPWGMRGVSILAVDGYMHYRDTMNQHASAFDQAKYDFIHAYPAERANAQTTLGSLFNLMDYPEEVESRFSFAVNFLPVPSGGDFRVALHDSFLDEIRAEVEASTKKAANDAILAVYERAEGVLTSLAEKLAGYEPAQAKGERSKGVFRDTLVENVRDMARTLPMLNVFHDPAIADLAERLAKVAEFDATDLRDSDAMRAATIASATATIADIRAATSAYF